MRALTWQGKRDVRVETVPDPRIEKPDDIIVKVTSSGICGSDLHLYELFGPYLDPGDILGHEAMGMVEEVGPDVHAVAPGDRVVIPFNISCRDCFMCDQGLHSQCETTQVRERGSGGALFGYTKLYGQVPGGQAESLRVPFGNKLPVKVPAGPPDDRYVYLSDVLPTAWQAVEYADIPPKERSPSWASGLSGTWPLGSPGIAVPAWSSAWTSSTRVSPGPPTVASPASTRDATERTCRRPSGSSRTGAEPTRSSTPSAWRRMARPSPSRRSG